MNQYDKVALKVLLQKELFTILTSLKELQ